MKIIILAGGRGTRLFESARILPKALVEVAGKPIIQYQIDLLEKHGFSDIRFSLGFRADQIIHYLAGKYEYVVEQENLGTGGAIKFASKDLTEPFMALNGDVISNVNIRKFAEAHRTGTNTIVVSYHKQNTDCGLLKIDNSAKITQFLEKPQEPTDGYVNVGFYILDPAVFRAMEKSSFSIEYDIFPQLAKQDKLYSFTHQGSWIDIGTEKRLKFMRSSTESTKITIFTVPKAFVGKTEIIQRNAILSWSKLHKDVEIILFGNNRGVQEFAESSNTIRHVPNIKINKYGTPLLSDIFHQAAEKSRHTLLCYASSDIIFTSSFIEAVKKLSRKKKFLTVGRQTDMDIDTPLDFNPGWEDKLLNEVKERGTLHGYSAMNMMIFPKHLNLPLYDFLIGKPGWDNAFVYKLIEQKIPIIDATLAIMAIRQNDEHTHHQEEVRHNFELAGGLSQMVSIRNAHMLFTPHGLVKPSYPRRLYALLLSLYPIRRLLGLKRWLQHTMKR